MTEVSTGFGGFNGFGGSLRRSEQVAGAIPGHVIFLFQRQKIDAERCSPVVTPLHLLSVRRSQQKRSTLSGGHVAPANLSRVFLLLTTKQRC
jgi:hypothetical protein